MSNDENIVLDKLREEYDFFSKFEKDPMMRELSIRIAQIIEFFDPEFERKFYCGY
jgi:hypothetical protein